VIEAFSQVLDQVLVMCIRKTHEREELPDIAKPLPVLSRRREPILYDGHDGEVVHEKKERSQRRSRAAVHSLTHYFVCCAAGTR
jgi:hypothetical protein